MHIQIWCHVIGYYVSCACVMSVCIQNFPNVNSFRSLQFFSCNWSKI